MRITAEAKDATRGRIVESAVSLFRTRGFDATTTRDIAQAAAIATGTLFNYFATKEAVVEHVAREALMKAHDSFSRQAIDGDFEEELFGLVAAELRQLKSYRRFITPLLEISLCPLAAGQNGGPSENIRIEHLEIVAGLVRKHGLGEASPVGLQLYWALYTGVLAFWAVDKSPRQEDTLALLDESLGMFTAWLRRAAGETQ